VWQEYGFLLWASPRSVADEATSAALGRSIDVTDSAGTTLGNATIKVNSGAGSAANGSMQIERVAPGFYSANQQGTGVATASFLKVAAEGTRTQGLHRVELPPKSSVRVADNPFPIQTTHF
jgi:hypothetical protein